MPSVAQIGSVRRPDAPGSSGLILATSGADKQPKNQQINRTHTANLEPGGPSLMSTEPPPFWPCVAALETVADQETAAERYEGVTSVSIASHFSSPCCVQVALAQTASGVPSGYQGLLDRCQVLRNLDGWT